MVGNDSPYYTPSQREISHMANCNRNGTALYDLVSSIPGTPTIQTACDNRSGTRVHNVATGSAARTPVAQATYNDDGIALNDQQTRALKQKERMLARIKERQQNTLRLQNK